MLKVESFSRKTGTEVDYHDLKQMFSNSGDCRKIQDFQEHQIGLNNANFNLVRAYLVLFGWFTY